MENYIVSARKYRPATFDTVIGQNALTTTLKNAIATNKLAHAYLFCGPRGVGKTTCARIFAKAINCLNPREDGEACNECESCKAFNEQRSYNIFELDAASNNSVDEIRSLIEQVRIPPQIGKYKVYIIDEVHMLSASAFNAFLKTLEEPPKHALFILATTEKHKILPTILSRCQIYDFNRISISDAVAHLQYVAKNEGIEAEPEALNIIAQKADGGMRDALSIFDQVVSFTNGHVTYKQVLENLNVLDYEYFFKLTDYFLENKVAEAMLLLNDIINKGFQAGYFITGLASHFRDLLVSKDEQTASLLEVGASIREKYITQAKKCDNKFLYKALKLCNTCDLNYRTSKNKRLLVELTLIECAQITQGDDDDSSGGRCPNKKLKPIFKQQTIADSSSTGAQKSANVTANIAQTVENDKNSATVIHKNPIPLTKQENKIPVVKKGSLSISIRRPANNSAEIKEPKQEFNNIASSKPNNRIIDKTIDENDLGLYWREFAAALPIEEKANSGRMMIMKPKLTTATNFEVVVDNEMVEKFMIQLRPKIVNYLKVKLENRQITMTIRISTFTENKRAYNQVERFQMMSKKNPNLLKLKESFGLEFS